MGGYGEVGTTLVISAPPSKPRAAWWFERVPAPQTAVILASRQGGARSVSCAHPRPLVSNAMPAHTRWVRICHGIIALSVLTLSATGFLILMAHPRLYWGEAGNDLTPALLELPISRNYQHGGWGPSTPFFQDSAGPASANRTFRIFNENGWGRSLHFLAAWCLVLPGLGYLLIGIGDGHFRAHIWPGARALTPGVLWRDAMDHLRLKIPPATGGPQYGLLQRCAYLERRVRSRAADGVHWSHDGTGGDGGFSMAAAGLSADTSPPARFISWCSPRSCCSWSCTWSWSSSRDSGVDPSDDNGE